MYKITKEKFAGGRVQVPPKKGRGKEGRKKAERKKERKKKERKKERKKMVST
jgi:hypothetical protein